MDYNSTWLGLAGGGFGLSAIGGVGVYQINLWNMGGNPVPIRALIIGKRLGVTLQAEAAHAVCLMTNVRSASSFTTIKSSGVDWAVGAGVKADAFVKSGSKIVSGLFKFAKDGNWAAQEGVKKLVQGLMGDFTPGAKTPQFVLLPSPAALSIGGGIWYEWQTLEKVGTDLAWEYAPPKFRMERKNGKLLLRMKGVPEQNNARINFRIRENDWGTDDELLWRKKGSHGRGEPNLNGTIYDGKLWNNGRGAGKGQDGFALSDWEPVGKMVTGMLSVSRNKLVTKNAWQKVGVSVCRGRINLYKWESDHYSDVMFDKAGVPYLTTDKKRWYE